MYVFRGQILGVAKLSHRRSYLVFNPSLYVTIDGSSTRRWVSVVAFIRVGVVGWGGGGGGGGGCELYEKSGV